MVLTIFFTQYTQNDYHGSYILNNFFNKVTEIVLENLAYKFYLRTQ